MSKVNLITLALAKKYTDKSMEGGGAVAGKNCTVSSITPITGGNRVTFLWTLDDGTEQTDTMDVMDGQDGNDGADGNGIASVEKTGTSGLVDTYTITFTNGDTTTFTVTNGADGEDGEGIPTGGTAGQVLVKKSSEDYDTEWDAPAGGGDMLKSVYDTDNDGKVDSAENADTVGGHTVAKDVPADAVFTDTVYDDTELAGKVSAIEGVIPSDATTSNKLATEDDIPDVSNFITNTVNNLVNYYLKTETYTKTEVDNIATAIKNSRFEVVATLPTTDIKTNVIYLVPKSPSQTSNVKDEYINLDGTSAGWEKIGDTEIDLSDYVTTQALNTALADYTTTADLTTLLAAKQDTLTFDNAPTENSNNPVKSGGVYSANQNIYEVMGEMGAKNLIPYPHDAKTETKAGITFTENADGSITVNGTATDIARHLVTSKQFKAGEKYILSGCPSGGAHSPNGTYTLYTQTINNYDDGEGVEFTWNASITGITIAVYTGVTVDNLTFYPMIRLASDTDSTYQPYAKTNKQLTDDAEALTSQANDMVNVLGAKNVLPFPYYAGSGTYNGVTITDNGDGSITLDGTCTGMSFFVFYGGRYSLAPTTFVKKNEDYIATLEVVSGSMAINSGTSRFVFRNYITNATSPFVDIFYEENVIDTRSVKFTYEPTASYDTSLVWYEFNVGTTFNNWRIRPMIRLASIQDDTWVPYVPTNKELMSCKLNGYVGAKNLLPYPYKHTTKSENGVTFTDNGDGTITVNTPTSASAETTFYLSQSIQSILDTGMYILSGCPSDGNRTSGYFMEFAELATSSSNWKMFGTDTGEGAIAHIDSTHYAIHAYIRIRSGATVSNLTFKPMIRRVEDTDPTWQPYAKTNKELTEAVDGMMMKVGRYTKTVKGTNTTYGALIDQICADMKTMIDGFADTNTNVIPMSITIDSLVTLFVRSDQYKKGDNFNIVAYCASCDGTTFNTFYLRGLSGSGNSTIYRQDVTASSQAINDLTSTSFTGDKNISLIYDRYQII